MRVYTLEYREDQESGELGFHVHGATLEEGKYNMATDGLLIAHDILEHQRIKDIGSIGDELKAMGAIWYIRGQFGDFPNSIVAPQDNISSDITRMARDYVYNPYFDCPVPIKNKHWLHEEFTNMITKARGDLHHELDDSDRGSSRESEYFTAALAFMTAGYQAAERRFKRIGGGVRANSLFHSIQRAVDTALKWAEHEGQQFTLHVNFKDCTAECREYIPDEYLYN